MRVFPAPTAIKERNKEMKMVAEYLSDKIKI